MRTIKAGFFFLASLFGLVVENKPGARQSNDPLPGFPEQFARVIREDVERWARVVKSAGIKSE